MMARRRSPSDSTACSPVASAAAIAASYDAAAPAIHTARSKARASISRSGAGRGGAPGPACPEAIFSEAVMTTSPGDGVVGEMGQPPRDLLRAGVVRRRHIIDDCEKVGRVCDFLGGRHPGRVAVRV